MALADVAVPVIVAPAPVDRVRLSVTPMPAPPLLERPATSMTPDADTAPANRTPRPALALPLIVSVPFDTFSEPDTSTPDPALALPLIVSSATLTAPVILTPAKLPFWVLVPFSTRRVPVAPRLPEMLMPVGGRRPCR